MIEKLDYYDVIGTLVPGVLSVAWLAACFPEWTTTFESSGLTETFGFIAAVAAAILCGQLLQAIGSVVQSFLYWTWGGKPSERAFAKGLGNKLSKESATRIEEKLAKHAGTTERGAIFHRAMHLTEAAGISRAARFNALYAYHRSLVVLVAAGLGIAIASRYHGVLKTWTPEHFGVLVGALAAGLIAAWHRAKMRAFHYVREVLNAADKVLDERSSSSRQF